MIPVFLNWQCFLSSCHLCHRLILQCCPSGGQADTIWKQLWLYIWEKSHPGCLWSTQDTTCLNQAESKITSAPVQRCILTKGNEHTPVASLKNLGGSRGFQLPLQCNELWEGCEALTLARPAMGEVSGLCLIVTRLLAAALKTSGSRENTLKHCWKIESVSIEAGFLQNTSTACGCTSCATHPQSFLL